MTIKIWKDKEGNWITASEFVKRFREGIQKITPLQQVQSEILGMEIMILGCFCGLIISMVQFVTLWWLSIIMFGALFVQVTQFFGLRQKKKLYEMMEENMKGGEDVVEEQKSTDS